VERSKPSVLIVRISEAKKAELKAAAEAAGAKNLSTWVRMVLLAAARRWTAPAAE
jgi:hypothetical protein